MRTLARFSRLFLVLPATCVFLQAQQIAARQSALAASVSTQAKLDADWSARFDQVGAAVLRARLFQIVTPSATDRVRLSVRLAGEPDGEIQVSGLARRLSKDWTTVATSDSDQAEFSVTLNITCTAATSGAEPCRPVSVVWKYDIVAN